MKKQIQFLQKTEITRLKKQYKKTDETRETIIKLSRDIQKNSKIAIYDLQRNNVSDAEKRLSLVKKTILEIQKNINKIKGLDNIGSYNASLEEYVEASTLLAFKKGKPFPTAKELDVSDEIYLQGLSDLTGELTRIAINDAIRNDYKEIEIISEVIKELYRSLLEFNFRNGATRKKFDAIKYNYQKIEDLILSIKLKNN